jgi:hypothetical protein
MIILKLITILFLTLFIWFILRLFIGVFKVVSFLRAGFQGPFAAKQRSHASSANQQSTMVQCATCNLYISDGEAIYRNGMYFCCNEHAK